MMRHIPALCFSAAVALLPLLVVVDASDPINIVARTTPTIQRNTDLTIYMSGTSRLVINGTNFRSGMEMKFEPPRVMWHTHTHTHIHTHARTHIHIRGGESGAVVAMIRKTGNRGETNAAPALFRA